jgi:hypothetical protein
MKNVLKQKFIAASATGAMLLAQAGGPVGMGVAGGTIADTNTDSARDNHHR